MFEIDQSELRFLDRPFFSLCMAFTIFLDRISVHRCDGQSINRNSREIENTLAVVVRAEISPWEFRP